MYCALVVVGITVSCERPKLQHTNPLIRLTLHPPAHPEVHCFIPWSISSPCSGQFEVQCSGCLWMTQESWKRGNCSCFLLAQRPCRLPRRPLLCSPALSQGLWELSGVSSSVFMGDGQCMAMKKCLRNYVLMHFIIIIIHNRKNIP